MLIALKRGGRFSGGARTLAFGLQNLVDLVQQPVGELVAVLVLVRPERYVRLLDPAHEFFGCDHTRLFLVGVDFPEQVLQQHYRVILIRLRFERIAALSKGTEHIRQPQSGDTLAACRTSKSNAVFDIIQRKGHGGSEREVEDYYALCALAGQNALPKLITVEERLEDRIRVADVRRLFG